jgi:hypothetical protein
MKKNTIIIIIVVLIAGAVYFYFFGGAAPESETLEAKVNPEIQVSATRVLGLLNQIKSLKIDPKIFESPEYQTLRDYSVAIPQLNVGRSNPFAPLPGVSSNPTSRSNTAPRR